MTWPLETSDKSVAHFMPGADGFRVCKTYHGPIRAFGGGTGGWRVFHIAFGAWAGRFFDDSRHRAAIGADMFFGFRATDGRRWRCAVAAQVGRARHQFVSNVSERIRHSNLKPSTDHRPVLGSGVTS